MKLLRFSTVIAILFSMLLVPSWAEQAPDWQLKDAEGTNVSLADYKGRPLVLHFWATWCPYCKTLQPGLDSLYKDFNRNGLALVGISILEKEGALPQKVLEERGLSFKTLLHGETVAEWYGVQGTPTTFFIDRRGAVIWKTNNSNPDDPKFEQAVEYILTN